MDQDWGKKDRQPKEPLAMDSDDGAGGSSLLDHSAGQSTRLGSVAVYD